MVGSGVRRAFGLLSRRTLVGLAVVAALGVSLAAWQLRGSSAASAPVPTVTATRGDIVVSVRALGKVVDARAAEIGTTPAGGAGQPGAGGSALAGISQVVSPRVGGRVIAVLVAPGQHVVAGAVVARLDPATARDNLALAQASLDQAVTQLEIDRSGVTPQSLASANAAITSAAATLTGARDALARTTRVNRAAIAGARQQVAQAEVQLKADSGALGPSPQATAAARDAVDVALGGLASARAALTDVRAVNAQQIATGAHAVDAARQGLAVDQSRLERDLGTERRLCGTTSPTVTADTSSECVNAAAAVASDQQAIVTDLGAIQLATDALAQTRINAAQSEHQAQSQVAATLGSLKSAREQLTALKQGNSQAVTKDCQALATSRSALVEARSRAADSAGQAIAQVLAASVGVSNARAALVALEQGAPGPLLAQDRSKILTARVQVATGRSGLAQTLVRAPASGTITGVYVAPGSSVDGTTPVAAIADLEHLAVTVDLSEFDAAQVRRGMNAIVSVDALGGKRLLGRVVFESLTGIDNSGVVTFPIRIALKQSSGVRIGMNVSAQIIVARHRNVVTVSLEAVSSDDQGRPSVSVVNATGGTSVRVVTLGLANNKDVEVTRGLRAGEHVELATQGA